MYMNERSRRDGGFTLIELLLVMVILGVLTIPLGDLVIGYFRNSTQTTLRLNESHDAQIVNAYWQQDVASIGVRGSFDTGQQTFPLLQSVNTNFPCALPSGVTSPFTVLAWNTFDATGNPTLVSVGYATASSGSKLVRLQCTTSTLDSSIVIAHNLVSAPAVACAGLGGSSCTGTGTNVPATISLSVSLRDPADTGSPYTATLTGQRRETT
jgi:prepilin-type N-terminal cleavage/methylation domain-containing protein